MAENKIRGEFEAVVLMAVMKLRAHGYGTTIRQEVEAAIGRPVSVGALYTTLDRLEEKGFVSSWQGDPTPERGGRAKRYFQIEGTGEMALTERDAVHSRLMLPLKPGYEGFGGAS